jgi:hypothetical protein
MRDRLSRFTELLTVRLPPRTLARINATLRQDEDGPAAFVRAAVERELAERAKEQRVERISTWIV